MLWLAMKTLFYERGRLIITLTGIVFSTVLTLAQVSMYMGMMGNATGVIRHTDADIWVMSKNVQNFDFANPFPEERINKVRAMPNVLWADRLILTWGFLKLASGGQEQVQIIGFNPDTGVGAPWSMVSGLPSDVKGGRYMIIDRTSEKRLGGLQPGSVWELNQVQFKLAGLSEGTRSFTTAPVIFIGYNQAHRFMTAIVREDQTTYIVAKLRDTGKTDETVKALRAVMKDNDIISKKDFIKKTVLYWTIQTGIGMGFFLTALLGLIVGGAIVGQTVYANTMEHLREFGTLKALGARNSEIYTVIFSQVGLSAVFGFVAGSLLMLFSRNGIEKTGVSFYLHPMLFVVLFLVVLSTCFLSAFFSVRKIRTLDPVTVFRT
jgi:putative ABC transport system permease protein